MVEWSVSRYTSGLWPNSTVVNTRSVYHGLKDDQGDPDNLSLCPILDLANHHFDEARAIVSRPIPSLVSTAKGAMQEGDEVYLKYGSHDNRFLFLHYGFVCREPGMEQSVLVDDVFEQVILSGRSKRWLEEIEAVLEECGYWRYTNGVRNDGGS